jgi:hypothetical protein
MRRVVYTAQQKQQMLILLPPPVPGVEFYVVFLAINKLVLVAPNMILIIYDHM